MARIERTWHPEFLKYQNMIVEHRNYSGLPILKKVDGSFNWVITTPSDIGNKRKLWAEEKAKTLGFKLGAGVYADVMREIHPTKKHTCQICGSVMSIYYHYPSVNFAKTLSNKFNLQVSTNDHISDIWDNIISKGTQYNVLIKFFQDKFEISEKLSLKNEVIAACEFQCRKNNKKFLSPGVMSNFPDRFDGFHTYNRCCRGNHDTGRSKENLKSYTKDRRAFELWSDGNIHAANLFMGSSFFNGTSADHIGAISLGFVHDPRYIRPMSKNENSAKRDRLTVNDIDQILEIHTKTNIYPMTWYSIKLWEYIKQNYKTNPSEVGSRYRNLLKQNFINYMFILKFITENNGKEFLTEKLLKPHYEDFMYDYEFDEFGEIIAKTDRNFTERNKYEFERYVRIAFDSVDDYDKKENRHLSPNLKKDELEFLNRIIGLVKIKKYDDAFILFKRLMLLIQHKLLN